MRERHNRSATPMMPFKIDVLYTDEEADMRELVNGIFSWLPKWHPPEPIDEESSKAWLISLALILSSCKRAHKKRVEEKPVSEDLSQFDHIYDPDGIYRTSKFDGMLGEDAADDVEIPSQLNKSEKSGIRNVSELGIFSPESVLVIEL
ncbi:hypothetical protein ANCCAN_01010 [Ancylostoma caninum]|uniref:Uncharacterized protein n=1 Tax=Ancylostoma caninum TaxID=29170 RepID=A0A368H8T7_ANCCA|nr:hypothetical protein ANCCAN_01010 [Ancylostoma caninum]